MQAGKVTSIKAYADGTNKEWAAIEPDLVNMAPTPIGMQPTEYIRVSWEGREHGRTSEVRAAAVHDGEYFAIRLQWQSPAQHPSDAIAVAFPVRGKPLLVTMGQKDHPVNFLHWRSRNEGARSVLAEGIGTTRLGPDVKATASAHWENGLWTVVLSRALGEGNDVAPLLPGVKTGIGFAVWEGANQERAGIKAFSLDWQELLLGA